MIWWLYAINELKVSFCFTEITTWYLIFEKFMQIKIAYKKENNSYIIQCFCLYLKTQIWSQYSNDWWKVIPILTFVKHEIVLSTLYVYFIFNVSGKILFNCNCQDVIVSFVVCVLLVPLGSYEKWNSLKYWINLIRKNWINSTKWMRT